VLRIEVAVVHSVDALPRAAGPHGGPTRRASAELTRGHVSA
jgi:hypothetical protein